MIKVFVRWEDDADGTLFAKVDSIAEIKDIEEFFKSTPIYNYDGLIFGYSCTQIEFNDEVTVEIILEVV